MANSVTYVQCAFERGKLYGEVSDGRAFDDPAGERQTSCFGRQPIQKGIQTPAAYNIDPFKRASREPHQITQNLAIPMREAMEDEDLQTWEEKIRLLERPRRPAPEAAG